MLKILPARCHWRPASDARRVKPVAPGHPFESHLERAILLGALVKIVLILLALLSGTTISLAKQNTLEKCN
ncbi:hypothetical protein [Pseudoruegeria sp. HB172150]|uniref:hypothetical protein n=1 Tax=Pseudoruegeria sp. HB172150 TaxID=2721164 RepID=UPI0015538AFA|nr:hypothetical protein [Pseudoruegeria sp. HB172150]